MASDHKHENAGVKFPVLRWKGTGPERLPDGALLESTNADAETGGHVSLLAVAAPRVDEPQRSIPPMPSAGSGVAGVDNRSEDVSSLSIRAAAICLTIALLAAAGAYAVGRKLPATFQSSGTVRIAVSSQQGTSDPVILGANDLASQYAQLVSSVPVTALAAKSLRVPAASLTGKISGSTVAAQNLIQITASARSPTQAEARAHAATNAFAQYVTQIDNQQAADYAARVSSGVMQLDAEIARLKAHPTQNAMQIAQLIGQRALLLSDVAQNNASSEPSLQIIDARTVASQTAPKPKLYALVALVLVLIVAGRLAFVLSRQASPAALRGGSESRAA